MRLGIVGAGSIAAEVLPQLRGWGWEPAALCGTPRSRDLVQGLCARHGIPRACTDYAALLREADFDTVYLAVPNSLHCRFAQMALESGRNVIVEKPIASNDREAAFLSALARRRGLYLFEAISTAYLPNYQTIQAWLPRIGDVRIVSCNFSQYSHRYDAFRAGQTPPVFDPARSGGAMMDLNLYNIHWLMGLFGVPKGVRYHANVERGIDTSGLLTLDYGSFQAVSIAAKDCAAPWDYTIQGVGGYIQQRSPANSCLDARLHLNDGREEAAADAPGSRLGPEFVAFARQIASGDRTDCYRMLDRSVAVSRVQTQARLDAGVRFPADDAAL